MPLSVRPLLPLLLRRNLAGKEEGRGRKARGAPSEPQCWQEHLSRCLLSRTVISTHGESPSLPGPERRLPGRGSGAV